MTKPVPRQRWRTSRGVLWVIAGLLLASGVIRTATGVGPALARGVSDIQAAHPGPAPDPSCVPDADITAALQAIRARQSDLDAREAAIADRLAALSLAETEIDRNLAALKQAEEALAATLALADTAAENDLSRLTSVYENMKPKDAAALFEEMEPGFAAGFLGRMRPDTAAAVMAGLSPQAAYTISVVLAGRNANVPTD